VGYRSFDRATSRGFIAWLTPIAQNIRRPDRLVEMLLEELRRQRVLLPVWRFLEMLVHQARTRAEQVSYHALAEGLTETQLDRPRHAAGTETRDRFERDGVGTAGASIALARNILALVERVRFIRALGIERDRQRNIPKAAFDRLAAESVRMTVQHVRDLAGIRRHATLVAAATSIETNLTDTTLLMFDKLMGSLARKAARRTADNSVTTLRQAHGNLRTLASACRAMIAAREGKTDPFAAVESGSAGRSFCAAWPRLRAWRGPRRPKISTCTGSFAPALLEAFEFRGGGAGKPRLKGITKRGNVYLRKLLIHGARAAMTSLSGTNTALGKWLRWLVSVLAGGGISGVSARRAECQSHGACARVSMR